MSMANREDMSQTDHQLLHFLRTADKEGAESGCRSICTELASKAAVGDEREGCALLIVLEGALGHGPEQEVEELLDRCVLDMCAPVIVAGSLGPDCSCVAEGILRKMAMGAPARDVYTGIVEGVSMAPSEYWNCEGGQIARTILELLPGVVSRISRRRNSFLGPYLQFSIQLSKKITDASDMDDSIQSLKVIMKSTQECFQNCGYSTKIPELPAELSALLTGFFLLLARLLLPAAVVEETGQELPGEESPGSLELLDLFAKFSTLSGFLWRSFQFEDLASTWAVLAESDQLEVAKAMKEGAGLLIWGSAHSELLQQALEAILSIPLVLKVAFELCSTALDESLVLAGLQLLMKSLQKPTSYENSVHSTKENKEIVFQLLDSLIEHMHENGAGHVKMHCLAGIHSILGCLDDGFRWDAQQKLIHCPFPEISAIMFQDFKSMVIKTRNNQVHSKFNSEHVVEVITKILDKCTCSSSMDENLIRDHADLLAAALNLYRYLCLNIQGARNGEDDIGAISEETVGFVKDRCKVLRQFLTEELHGYDESNSETVDQMMGSQRLYEVITRVQELI